MTTRLKTGPESLREPPPVDLASEELRAVTKKEIVRTSSEAIGMTQLQTKDIVQKKAFSAIIRGIA